MKIFSIRNLLGVAAIYGAAQYAKKNGGARNAFEGLLAKVKDAANLKKDELIGRAHDASVGSKQGVEPAASQKESAENATDSMPSLQCPTPAVTGRWTLHTPWLRPVAR